LKTSVLLFASATGLLVQQETASITGQVIDATGAAVPKAIMVTRNESTAASFQTMDRMAGGDGRVRGRDACGMQRKPMRKA
jgi:hypothetical protein